MGVPPRATRSELRTCSQSPCVASQIHCFSHAYLAFLLSSMNLLSCFVCPRPCRGLHCCCASVSLPRLWFGALRGHLGKGPLVDVRDELGRPSPPIQPFARLRLEKLHHPVQGYPSVLPVSYWSALRALSCICVRSSIGTASDFKLGRAIRLLFMPPLRRNRQVTASPSLHRPGSAPASRMPPSQTLCSTALRKETLGT